MAYRRYVNGKPEKCQRFQRLYHGHNVESQKCFKGLLDVGREYICPSVEQTQNQIKGFGIYHPWFKKQTNLQKSPTTCMHNQPNIGVNDLCSVCHMQPKCGSMTTKACTQSAPGRGTLKKCNTPDRNINRSLNMAGSDQFNQNGGGCGCNAPMYSADGRLVKSGNLNQFGAGYESDIKCHDKKIYSTTGSLVRDTPLSNDTICQEYSDLNRFNVLRQYKNISQESFGHYLDLSADTIGKRPVRSFHDNSNIIPKTLYKERMNLTDREFNKLKCSQPLWCPSCI